MKDRKNKEVLRDLLIKIIVPASIVLFWQYSCSSGMVNENILPSPLKIIQTIIVSFQKGQMQKNLTVSGLRVIKGFFIGSSLGIVLGVAMGLSSLINKILNSIIGVIRPIPMLAWIPLFILWLGIGEKSKVALIALGALWPTLLNTISGIRSADKKLIEVATIMRKSKSEILFRIIFPSAMPSILTGLRLGIGTAWACVVGAEMVAASSGLGYMITYYREIAMPELVFSGVFIIGIVGLAVDFVVLKIQKYLLRWNDN